MKKSYIIFLFVVFTILSFEIIYFSRVIKNQKKISAQNVESHTNNISVSSLNKTKSVSVAQVKISPSCKLDMIQYYEKCGHVIEETHNVPSKVVNMNEEEFKKYYNGWDIQFFSKDYVKMVRIIEGNCDEHFILKDIDGYISIYSEDENENEKLYKATDIVTKYLSDEDKKKLEAGVRASGKDELETILQDYE